MYNANNGVVCMNQIQNKDQEDDMRLTIVNAKVDGS